MSVLPIVGRELRVAARRPGAFWVRVIAAAAAVALGALQLWIETDWGSAADLGRRLFEGLAMVAFGLSLAAGPGLTTDVLSEEKREGTLGLLFLTDLRALDVVLGKLAAASVSAVFALLAFAPVLALSLLLGGISPGEFARVMLALGNTLWFSLTAGLAMSALCVQGRSAFALTGLVLFLAAAFLPWLRAETAGTVLAPVGAALAWLGPADARAAAAPAVYAAHPAGYWIALGAPHALAWGFVGVAAWVTGRGWREATSLRLGERWQERWLVLLLGDRGRRQALRARLLDHNPLLWLGSRPRLKRNLLWSACGTLLAAWLVLAATGNPDWRSPGMTLLIAGFLQVTLKWLAASEAAYRFAEDRRSGALELILTTGLDERQIVRGQMLAMRRLFGGPALAVLGVEAGLLVAGGALEAWDAGWLPAAAIMIRFIWDLRALAWTGMWYSVAGRRPQWASMRAVFRVLVVPWLVFLGVLFVVGVWNWTVVVLLWLGIGGLSNHLAWRTARTGLFSRFRAAAAGVLARQRPGPARGSSAAA